jgi:hypothetical protein
MVFYTITGKTDGFGAQYQAMLSGLAFCTCKKGYTYVHSPFTTIEHGVDVNKANIFIGINNNNNNNNNNNKLIPSDITIKKPLEPEVHWSLKPSRYYTDKVLTIIRQYYYSTEKPVVDNIDIAIHIRRGDVTKGNRYIDNSFYKQLIIQLQAKYPNYKITIFSEGNYEDFKDLGLDENSFMLNMDVFVTFHSLVCAKVLIQSYSSFSYCAGLLNTNTVYYFDGFWHKKLDKWLKISALVNRK